MYDHNTSIHDPDLQRAVMAARREKRITRDEHRAMCWNPREHKLRAIARLATALANAYQAGLTENEVDFISNLK